MSWREHRDYSPGGLSGKSLARVNRQRRWRAACKGGKASGRRRREIALARRGNAGPGQQHVTLSYELRQPSRREHRADYEKVCPPPDSAQGAAQWERGLETSWQLLMGAWRLVCVEKQHCATTKPQRAGGLKKHDRERCEKTVQRHMRRLELMGYVGFLHVRTPKGAKDHLRVEWRLTRRLPAQLDVPPPSGTVNPASMPGVHRRAGDVKSLIAPAAPAENVPPSGGERPGHPESEEPYVPGPETLARLRRIRAETDALFDDFATAGRGSGPGPDVRGDVQRGGGGAERTRGGVGLPQDEGSVPGPGGEPADRSGQESAGGSVGGDEVGGGTVGGP